jgi:hypothetical protein
MSMKVAKQSESVGQPIDESQSVLMPSRVVFEVCMVAVTIFEEAVRGNPSQPAVIRVENVICIYFVYSS